MGNEKSLLDLPPRPAELAESQVAVWREPVTIDTYVPERPSRYPAYLNRRVYQGSSGRVYPLPFHDRISPEKQPVEWDAVHMENAWLRIMILPELGGRIHLARDLTTGYDFFYCNSVIKPALVGLAGPWIAGGVEFNWPQHHRPATFLPTDYSIEHEEDGATTVWCSDHEPFARMKGMHGVRLAPDRATIELRVRLYNRNEQTQTFLWWANVAARVNDNYQSYFPEDVHFVADHAKRAVTAFPAADRPYYGVDYRARRGELAVAADGAEVRGDRLDWYRNIPVPTSYMCLGTKGDFFGGYDHGVRAGFVQLADHHISPGKKQWTWGNDAFGRAWDRHLADDGAAYVELMAGVFTDNQPDFSFIAPGETKVFSQFWYPIQEIGPVKRATVDAALTVEVENGQTPHVLVGVATTSVRQGCRIEILGDAGVLASTEATIGPGCPYRARVPVDPLQVKSGSMRVRVLHGGAELVSWSQETEDEEVDLPDPAHEPAAPAAVSSIEELALIATHLEQYRHATRSPEPYWREALRRDPGHTASAIGLARRAYRRGRFAEAEALLRTAVGRITALNPNPPDTSAFYELGLVLERLGRLAEAYDAYARSLWTRPWRAPAGYRMARLDAAARRDSAALHRLDDTLRAEPEHLQARALRVILLRRLGASEAAEAEARGAVRLDPLDWWTRDLLGMPLTTDAQTCVDVALEYAGVGEPDEALRVLELAREREAHRASGQTGVLPLIDYHRAQILGGLGAAEAAGTAASAARSADPSYCFPARLDDAAALQEAITRDTADAGARGLLGHWLYAQDRAEDAIEMWATSAAIDPTDPVVLRNHGLALFNHARDAAGARAAYDAARRVSPTEPQLLFESDQLDARNGVAPATRLQMMRRHRQLVERRDDSVIELAHLLISAGELGEAREVLATREFQPWEGGEGKALAAWERLGREEALRSTARGDHEAARRAAESALNPPVSLGEARHPLSNSADLHLLHGDVLERLGRHDDARLAWEMAAAQQGDFQSMAIHEHSEATFSSVLALRRLGCHAEARELRAALGAFVERLQRTSPIPDYFATSLPSLLLFEEDLTASQQRRILFLQAQLKVLDDEVADACIQLEEVLAADPHHVEAIDLLRALDGSVLEQGLHRENA